jgi:hypothetical protein
MISARLTCDGGHFFYRYLCRGLSYRDASFELVTVELSRQQRAAYVEIAMY